MRTLQATTWLIMLLGASAYVNGWAENQGMLVLFWASLFAAVLMGIALALTLVYEFFQYINS